DVLRTWRGKLGIGLDYLLHRRGPMAIGINQGGLFARAVPTAPRPDVQFHVATLSSDMAGSKVHEVSGFTMSICQLRPEARGFVRIVDNELRVHGCAALRVVDCGMMPTLVSGNTNAPVVMIAEKAADMILRSGA